MTEEKRGGAEQENTYFGRIRAVVRETIGFVPVAVYYPGIGGGEEPIDPIGPFADLDADEVYGQDIWTDPYDPAVVERKLAVAAERLEKFASTVNATGFRVAGEGNLWQAEFIAAGKPKVLEIAKLSLDATTVIPPKGYPVIYGHRTYNLFEHLPQEVLSGARVVFDVEQYNAEAKLAKEFGPKAGFEVIDLSKFPGAKKLIGTPYSPSLVTLLIRK